MSGFLKSNSSVMVEASAFQTACFEGRRAERRSRLDRCRRRRFGRRA